MNNLYLKLQVDCGDRPNPIVSTLPPMTGTPMQGTCGPEVSSQCPAEDDPNSPVYLEDPMDCSRYCQCASGTAYERQCPGNTQWSEPDSACELPENVSRTV